MNRSSNDQLFNYDGGNGSGSDKQRQRATVIDIENETPPSPSPSLTPSTRTQQRNGGEMRESLITVHERRSSISHNFLKRFLFSILLLNLVPLHVDAWALNVNSGSSSTNANPQAESASGAPPESSLHQFYFRNRTSSPSPSQSVVISSSSDKSTDTDSQAEADPEPKTNLSHTSAIRGANSAENTIQHGEEGKGREKMVAGGAEAGVSPETAKNAHNSTNFTSGTISKPHCKKNGTSGYQHSVEDILRQIFGADGLDEDDMTNEDEDDEEFMNDYYRDRDDRYEFERSTFNGSTSKATAVLHARHARDTDSRRGPLQVDDDDDDDSGPSTEEEEDDDPQPQPDPPKPKPVPKKPGQKLAQAQNNKNRMNPPKQPVQQPNRKKQPQNKKPQKPKPPVNPAEKRAEMLAKYNAYVDAVFSRMNVLIKKKRMDPLRVNLYAGPSKPGGGGEGGNSAGSGNNSGGGGAGAAKAKNGKRKGALGKNKRKNSRMEDDSNSEDDVDDLLGHTEDHEEDDDESSGASSGDEERAFRTHDSSGVHDVHLDSNVFGRSIRSLLANISQYSHAVLSKNPNPSSEQQRFEDEDDDTSHGHDDAGAELETVEEGRGTKNGKGPAKNKNPKNRNGGAQNKNANSNGTAAKFVNKNKNKNKFNKNKNKNRNAPRPTRGILHGLSSLRRDGNVQVVKDGPKARIVRAKFLLGPVALEILPKKGKPNRGQSRENIDDNVSESIGHQRASPAGSAPSETTSAAELDSSQATSPGETKNEPATTPAATATAPQLRGILEIRLAPNRPTRIRKLRVFPPGNVQVDGDKANTNSGSDGPGSGSKTGSGYRKVTPQATARLRQTALQVVRQVDRRLRPLENGNGGGGGGGGGHKKPRRKVAAQE